MQFQLNQWDWCVYAAFSFLPRHPGLLVPPAFSLRKRLARWPGYMRSTAGPRIRFPSPAGSTPFQAQGWGCSEVRSPTTLSPGPDSVALALEACGKAPLLGALFPRAQQPWLQPL